MRQLRFMLVGFFVLSLPVLTTACFSIGGPGSGTGTGNERKITGTYQSDSVVVVFAEDGSYKVYGSKENFQANKDPDSEAEYTILEKEIIFKNDEGNEIPERGILGEDDKSFTWEQYPGQTFTRSEN